MLILQDILNSQQSEHWQHKWLKENRDRTSEVNIEPISLFNYRLDSAVNHDLDDDQVSDFQSLLTAFQRDLTHHKSKVSVNSARLAAERYNSVRIIVSRLGINLSLVPQTEVRASEHHEAGLIKGFKGLFHRHHHNKE